jgi:hypothetical protein
VVTGIGFNIKDIDLQQTNHISYEIGAKKDTSQFFRGCLRDLMIFNRALDYRTMLLLYSKYECYRFVGTFQAISKFNIVGFCKALLVNVQPPSFKLP